MIIRMEVSRAGGADVAPVSVSTHMVQHPTDDPVVSLGHTPSIIVSPCVRAGCLIDGSNHRAESLRCEVGRRERWLLVGIFWPQKIASTLKLGFVGSGCLVLKTRHLHQPWKGLRSAYLQHPVRFRRSAIVWIQAERYQELPLGGTSNQRGSHDAKRSIRGLIRIRGGTKGSLCGLSEWSAGT